jgi:hypothetical protein
MKVDFHSYNYIIMLFKIVEIFHKLRKFIPPNVGPIKKRVIEYPFCKITIGSSSTNFELGSLMPLIDAIPIGQTNKSNEWMTRGNRMRLDASIEHHVVEH